MGCVMRECREDVRLGIMRECSPWSVVAGLSDCLSRVRGRTKDVWSRREGPISVVSRRPKELERVNASGPLAVVCPTRSIGNAVTDPS